MATVESKTISYITTILFPEGNKDGVSADLTDGTVDMTEFTLAEMDTTIDRFRLCYKFPA